MQASKAGTGEDGPLSTVVYRRPLRRPAPELPRGEIPLLPPPELPNPRRNWMFLLYGLPMMAGGVAMVLMYTGSNGTRGPLGYVVGGLFGVSMLGMMGVGATQLGGRKGELNDGRRDYLRYLGQVRREVAGVVERQREAALWLHPDPDGLWSLVDSDRLWERRASDPDFGLLRVGLGRQRLATPLVPPQTATVEDLEPLSAVALRRFVRLRSTVPALPVAVSLRSFTRIALTGPRDGVTGLARALLGQLAAAHSPDDVAIWVCAAPDRLPEWDWVKWLPHAQHQSAQDAVGPVRLVSDRLADLEALAAADLAERPRFSTGGRLPADRRHLVVVLDGGAVPIESQVIDLDGVLGVTVLDVGNGKVAAIRPHEQDRHRLRLRVAGGRLAVAGADGDEPLGTADALSVPQAAALARQMARFRAGEIVDDQAPLTTNLGLTDLLGVGDPGALDPAETWRPRAPRDRLRIAIGVDEHGLPVELDLKESAQEGMGPHGLLIGATGSGKSELLRTLVTGLALTHSSETLNFVLVDFKGGATFAGLDDLPHVSATITNLADDLTLVDRMQDAVSGELVRRQELLKRAGNYASVRDYERAREAGADLAPLPSLLVICDEFSELLSAQPEFIDLFVQIGRLGRSLAIHLLLASQRLDEGRLRGLESHLSYRIGLRTFSAGESRTVLGSPAAYELPPVPGSGYLKIDTESLVRFKAAYVSGPYRVRGGAEATATRVDRRVLPFGTGFVAPADVTAPVDGAGPPDALAETHLDVIVSRLAGRGPAAHQVWLPPLAEPPTLDGLLAGKGPGRLLTVPVGLEDRPLEQRQAPLWADLAASNAVVVGAPLSGKSTLLRTLVAGLALTHTPEQVQFYCLDFGGGSLAGLAGLPHVGGVASRLDPERVRRTLAELGTLLVARERLFAEQGIDSMTTFRERRAAGQAGGDRYGDVFLVIDGWQSFRSEFEMMEQVEADAAVADLATRGLGYGIHVVLTATRWYDLRMNLRDVFSTRFELRLGDPTESVFDRRAATNVPQGVPGRGVSRNRLHFLAALPRTDGRTGTADLAAGVRSMVDEVAAGWTGPPAPPVRLLPRELPAAELPAPDPGPDRDRHRIPIGIREADLGPVSLDFGADPHFLCFGDVESGRTGLLRLLIAGLTRRYTPAEAQLVVVDYRRTLLDAAGGEHLLGYVSASTALKPLLADIVTALNERLPGPGITPAQLRARDWWHGPELFVIIDDHDLVSTPTDNPLLPLLELLPQARDIGLHVVVARPTANAQRSLFEPVIGRLRDLGTPGLILSGDRAEGPLLGNVRASAQPPGRGVLVSRRTGQDLVQVAWCPPPDPE
jgi:S-DNA-T family DNA segregation ATPase FtsK/SpoIIIE